MTLDRSTVLNGIPDELAAFGDLVRSLEVQQLALPTRCSGWTVSNVASHVMGTVVDVTQGRLDGQGTAEVTQRQATERGGRSPRDLADELAGAVPALTGLLESLPEDMWDGPSFTDPQYTLGFAVEAIWFDAYLHGEDIRAAMGVPPSRGPGLRCAVHHVAGYLAHRRWVPATLTLDGADAVDIAGGGASITGDPLDFVLAATGRGNPAALGLDDTVNVYSG